MALVAARGARSRKRVSEATSFEMRRFGLKNTSSRSRLALRRGHGPAAFAPNGDGERAQELYLYYRFGRRWDASIGGHGCHGPNYALPSTAGAGHLNKQ